MAVQIPIPSKVCDYCGKTLVRHAPKESPSHFRKRKYCDPGCAARNRYGVPPPGSERCGPICAWCGHPLKNRKLKYCSPHHATLGRRSIIKSRMLDGEILQEPCVCGLLTDDGEFPCRLCREEELLQEPDLPTMAWDGRTYPAKRRNRIMDHNANDGYVMLMYCVTKGRNIPLYDPDRTVEGRLSKRPTWLDYLLDEMLPVEATVTNSS